MEYVQAKSIISAIKPTDAYISRDYNMNIYRGCSHGCIYCDSRSLCYQIDRFDVVRAKCDALAIIEAELRHKRKKGIIATGAMSDPYNPFEQELCLTRGALKLVEQYGYGISITTKSPLAARDADVFGAIAQNAVADVRFTITALADEVSKKIEPHVAPASERFEALEKLSAAGAYTGVFITPVLPFITDTKQNITGIVRRAAECGAKNVVCMMGMTLRAGNREYYYQALDKSFPGLKQEYSARYGEAYYCPSPQANELYAAFKTACKQHGLLCEFREINHALKGMMDRQITLL